MIIQQCEIEGCEHPASYSHKILGLNINVCGACNPEVREIASKIKIGFEKFRQKQLLKIINMNNGRIKNENKN